MVTLYRATSAVCDLTYISQVTALGRFAGSYLPKQQGNSGYTGQTGRGNVMVCERPADSYCTAPYYRTNLPWPLPMQSSSAYTQGITSLRIGAAESLGSWTYIITCVRLT